MKHHRVPLLLALASVVLVLCSPREFLADDSFLVFQRTDPDRVASIVEFFDSDYWSGVTPSDLYRPFGLLFVYAERLLFGSWIPAYRLVSMLLHFAACLLIWRLFARKTGERIAGFAAMIFAVHPIHAEALFTVYGQFDLLAAVLVLCALQGGIRGLHLAGAISFGAALLCKESALVLPGLAPLMRRSFFRSSDLIYWGVLAGFFALRGVVLGTVMLRPEATVVGDAGLILRLKTILVSMGESIRLCLWPTKQTVYYGHLREALAGIPVTEALWIALGFTIAWLSLEWLPKRSASLAIGWFAICLVPIANIFPIGVIVAERALYLPSAGFALVAAAWLVRLENVWVARLAAACVAIGCLAALLFVAWSWRTELSLWESTVQNYPRSPKAHAMVGYAIQRTASADRYDRAEAAFQEALRLNPRSIDAIRGLGLLQAGRGNCAEAAAYLRRAAVARPNDETVQAAIEGCGL